MGLKSKDEFEVRFNELWQKYQPYIHKLCKYKLYSMPHHIDDCVQETFKALATAMKNGTVIEYPKTWLSAVANNIINDLYKKAKKEAEMFIPLSHEKAVNCAISTDELDIIMHISNEQIEAIKGEVLKQLTDEERQLINEYYVQNKKLKDMAQSYGYTESKMKKEMFVLRNKIKSISRCELSRQLTQTK